MQISGRNLAIVALVSILLLAGIIGFAVADDLITPAELADGLRDLGGWAPLAVIGLMIVHCFIPFPAEIVALCAGAVFGLVYGTILVWIGAMIGAILSFGLSRRLGQAALKRWLPAHQHATLDRWSREQGAVTLLVSRLVPVVAFNLINYAAGLTTVRFWTFVWTTGLGILPITILSAYMGAQMRDLSWSAILMVSGVGILAIWVTYKVAHKYGWIK